MSWFYEYRLAMGYILLLNLNTSYVLVLLLQDGELPQQSFIFKYILCLGSTIDTQLICQSLHQFKYILCLGST